MSLKGRCLFCGSGETNLRRVTGSMFVVCCSNCSAESPVSNVDGALEQFNTALFRRLVALAMLALSDGEFDQEKFAEENGLVNEYYDGREWKVLFQDECKKAGI